MKLACQIALVLLFVIPLAGWIVLRFSDGPFGPVAGGALKTGEWGDTAKVDWNEQLGGQSVGEIELQLVQPTGSRTTGAFAYEGDLYVPCDLGYVWRRLPNASTRRILHLIWLLKGWHEDAVADGRAVVRVGGKRYAGQLIRVTDPDLLAAFRERVSAGAAEYFGGLVPVDPSNQGDIWFFRFDPRTRDGVTS